MSNAALNIHIQVFVGTYVFVSLGYVPGNRIITFLLLPRNSLLNGRQVDGWVPEGLYC